MSPETIKGQATWNPRRVATAAGAPHTYEELANANGTFYEANANGQPPVPPHGTSDDSSLYSRPPINGGNFIHYVVICPHFNN